MNFVAITTVESTVFVGGPAVRFEITSLNGRVIARTMSASDANRAGAIAHARKNMGDAYAVDADGNRVEQIAHF